MLSSVLARYWWTTLLRGVVWILFGLTTFVLPRISLLTLTLVFGFFALVDGVAHVVSAFGGRQESGKWWVLLISGIAGILVGVLTFVSPGITAIGLLFYIAAWAIFTGILAIVAAIHLRKEIEGEFWLALAGLASVLFGVVLVARPGAGALALLWLIASYAIAFGVILIVLAFRARAFAGHVSAGLKGPASAATR
jgi:uncharacterized membrane protein HdeD (DUF308 family)